jgi:hypothetical protein
MKHTDFERKNPVGIKPKNPFLVQLDIICLKHAIYKAENQILTLMNRNFPLANSDKVLANIREAQCLVINALEGGELNMWDVIDSLNQANSEYHIERVHKALKMALEIVADDPIPYRLAETTICECGAALTIKEEIERGFCVQCAYGWHDESDGASCSKCNGTGYTNKMFGAMCMECQGTGQDGVK